MSSPYTPIPDSPAQARARTIMGKNFLGLEEVRWGYGIALPVEQLAEIPFSEETLRAYKDTHVLVAGAALSVNEIRHIAASSFFSPHCHNREPFANEDKVGVRWYLLRKEPVPESRAKSYKQQTALLKEEEVPFACEMIYMIVLYWLTHGERLPTTIFCVRCQDKTSDGLRVRFGHFNFHGFTTSCDRDLFRSPLIGLASSVPPRKS